jgi:hypothetical protein
MESGPGMVTSDQRSYVTPGPTISLDWCADDTICSPTTGGNASEAEARATGAAQTRNMQASAPRAPFVDTPARSPQDWRRPHQELAVGALSAAIAIAFVIGAAAPSPSVQAANTVRLALHLAPNTHITASRTITHVVSYQMNHTLMSLLGSRAAPTTLVDDRSAAIDVGADGTHVSIDDTSLRHFGGASPKDKSTITRQEKYVGQVASDAVRTPPQASLADAGDGALDQLPKDPVAVGATWTFSRVVLLDRSLAQATMTYTDTLKSLDQRAGHTIATITVTGTGMAQPASDLEAKGFKQSTFTFTGTAEFDVTAGLPGVQSYTAHVEWTAHPMFTRISIDFADTFAATAWTAAVAHP